MHENKKKKTKKQCERINDLLVDEATLKISSKSKNKSCRGQGLECVAMMDVLQRQHTKP
jgi:hypothetical protein